MLVPDNTAMASIRSNRQSQVPSQRCCQRSWTQLLLLGGRRIACIISVRIILFSRIDDVLGEKPLLDSGLIGCLWGPASKSLHLWWAKMWNIVRYRHVTKAVTYTSTPLLSVKLLQLVISFLTIGTGVFFARPETARSCYGMICAQ